MKVRSIAKVNFLEVTEIYKQGLAISIATFQNDLPQCEEWNKRHLDFCRISIYENNKMLGQTALTPV